MRWFYYVIFFLFIINRGYAQYQENFVGINTQDILFEKYANQLYDSLKCENLNYEVFKNGLKGYFYLKSSNWLENEKTLTLVDYSKSKYKKRLYVIDLEVGQVLFNELVVHAIASGSGNTGYFSNELNSKKNSLGFYLTGRTFWGNGGHSLRLFGLEENFNSNAFTRGIVFHGSNGKSSVTSQGCIVVNDEINSKIIEIIKGGSCLFVYFPCKEYYENSIINKFSLSMLK